MLVEQDELDNRRAMLLRRPGRAQRARTAHLRGAPPRRRPDDARGAVGGVRHQPRARPPDRGARLREGAGRRQEGRQGAGKAPRPARGGGANSPAASSQGLSQRAAGGRPFSLPLLRELERRRAPGSVQRRRDDRLGVEVEAHQVDASEHLVLIGLDVIFEVLDVADGGPLREFERRLVAGIGPDPADGDVEIVGDMLGEANAVHARSDRRYRHRVAERADEARRRRRVARHAEEPGALPEGTRWSGPRGRAPGR